MVPKDNWKIDLKKTALIVIDMQKVFLDPDSPYGSTKGRQFVPKLNELSDICRKLGIPVVYVRHSNRPDLLDVGLLQDIRPRTDKELEVIEGRKGVEFCEGLKVDESDLVVSKIRYSGFIPGSSSLGPLLLGLGRDSFMVCGVFTDVCVLTTTADAMMLGYKVFVVSDLTATLSDERQRTALEVLDKHFAKVMTFDEAKKELKELVTTAKVFIE